jgi:hypothetical protein
LIAIIPWQLWQDFILFFKAEIFKKYFSQKKKLCKNLRIFENIQGYFFWKSNIQNSLIIW